MTVDVDVTRWVPVQGEAYGNGGTAVGVGAEWEYQIQPSAAEPKPPSGAWSCALKGCAPMRCSLLLLPIIACLAAPASAQSKLQPQMIEDAAPDPAAKTPTGEIDPATVKVQVLLSRARFSPGEIDGKNGENIQKALRAFAAANSVPADPLNPDFWSKLTAASTGTILVEQALTEDYVKGPFLEKMPKKLDDMKDIKALSYVSAVERIAESFHVSPELLRALNPGKNFETAGETIVVPNVVMPETGAKVARIEVDKSAQTVRAFDGAGALLAFYPATVGSEEKPTPSGELVVRSVTRNPFYRYNPDYKFKGVKATKPFTINPGPNNPVGLVWIALSEKGYGIHGTPEPSKVSKAESNGCVRLTNWDVLALAAMVGKGVKVSFADAPVMAQEVSGARDKRR